MSPAQLDDRIARLRIAVALVGVLGLGACSSIATDVPLLPTSNIPPSQTSREAVFPPVGVRPEAGAPEFTQADRERARQELEAARQRLRETAATPADRPLPGAPATR